MHKDVTRPDTWAKIERWVRWNHSDRCNSPNQYRDVHVIQKSKKSLQKTVMQTDATHIHPNLWEDAQETATKCGSSYHWIPWQAISHQSWKRSMWHICRGRRTQVMINLNRIIRDFCIPCDQMDSYDTRVNIMSHNEHTWNELQRKTRLLSSPAIDDYMYRDWIFIKRWESVISKWILTGSQIRTDLSAPLN